MSIDPETGIKPIAEWGPACARGLDTIGEGYSAAAATSGAENLMGRRRQGEALPGGVPQRKGSRRKRTREHGRPHVCFTCGVNFESSDGSRVFSRLCEKCRV